MKRILGLGLFLALSYLPLLAAKNSETFLLPSEVRVGDTTLPEGHCNVTWTDASGSQVQLTIKTEDKKTINIPARDIEGSRLVAGWKRRSQTGSRTCWPFRPQTLHSSFRTLRKTSNKFSCSFPKFSAYRVGPMGLV